MIEGSLVHNLLKTRGFFFANIHVYQGRDPNQVFQIKILVTTAANSRLVVPRTYSGNDFKTLFESPIRALVLRQVTVMLDENITVFMKNLLIFLS